jgi:hypothetical protein
MNCVLVMSNCSRKRTETKKKGHSLWCYPVQSSELLYIFHGLSSRIGARQLELNEVWTWPNRLNKYGSKSTLQSKSHIHTVVGLHNKSPPLGELGKALWRTDVHSCQPSVGECYSCNIFLVLLIINCNSSILSYRTRKWE